jgi:hypothetical protein
VFEGVRVTSLEGFPLLSVQERKEEDQSFRKDYKHESIKKLRNWRSEIAGSTDAIIGCWCFSFGHLLLTLLARY